MNWFIRITGFLLLLITLLPLLSTGKWYVRWWDFPRLQIAVLMAVPLITIAAVMWTSGLRTEHLIYSGVLIAAIAWQLSHTAPFGPLWPTEVADSQPNADTFKVMVSNLDYENPSPQNVSAELAEENADILLLVEYDEGWKQRLEALGTDYPYTHEEVRGEGLGLAFWSKIPIKSAQTRHLVSDRRASLWIELEFESGEQVNFIGIHPTPPGLLDSTGETRRDSRVRDAELILIAREIAQRNDEAWILAGDFNDVAWSHTTRLFKRTSGLLDPRIGRGLISTYMANYPPFRCPIDHVFLSEGFTLGSLSRKRMSGSDHFAILTQLAFEDAEGVTPRPEGNDASDAKEIIKEGIDDAEERDTR
ncbi:endonuclease/exonuclease/phosphatase family protein [Mariniblastus fucicola]|uniref:Endonuclease/Exonuclease/phosphatase family protein n=1 Tax=Mariniblastus fucicola TaxID=980251 RepID=A0A5B9PIM0_9BACT|nr:endonuclease/exonuclease/phosphatase family protein [Mariniblastus fucicola]QEG25125.1 Endonuclease/Exonuclease/phosphatase family protein [Mariniblastus fucicola]